VDISRIEVNQLVLSMSDFEVEKELNHIVKSLQFEKHAADCSMKIVIDDNCRGLILHSDKERFKQIVLNLVNNALKFTSKGNVSISASIVSFDRLSEFYYNGSREDDGERLLLIAVADNGIGISVENQELIFQPFRKVESQGVVYPGVGLGLSIVKSLVKLLGGEIWLKSELGVGSTFYFYIPLS